MERVDQTDIELLNASSIPDCDKTIVTKLVDLIYSGSKQKGWCTDLGTQIEAIYLWGSHLFGTNDEQSDYDFIAVVSNIKIPEGMNNVLEIEQYDVCVYSTEYWNYLIDNHSAIIHPFRIPVEKAVWFTRSTLPIPDMNNVRIQRIRIETYADVGKELNESKTCLREGNMRKAKKRVINCIRNAKFGIQVIKYGKVVDLTECNSLHSLIMSDTQSFSNWDAFENWFDPMLQSTLSELKTYSFLYCSKEQSCISNSSMLLFDFLNKYGLEDARKYISIEFSRYKNLVLLRAKKEESPDDSKVAIECGSGIVLEEKSWKVVAYSLPWIPKCDRVTQKSDIDWNNVTVTEKYDGKLAVLYNYQGEWLVATDKTPDGSEIVDGRTISSVFFELWESHGYKFPAINFSYTFHILSPKLRNIVFYEKESLVLLSVRDLQTLQEVNIADFSFVPAKTYPLASFAKKERETLLTAVINITNVWFPLETAGVVICDNTFKRLVVYSGLTLALQQLLRTTVFSTKQRLSLSLIVQSGSKARQFVEYFPNKELKVLVENIYKNYVKMCEDIDEYFVRFMEASKGENKEFSRLIEELCKEKPWVDPFSFQILRTKRMSSAAEVYTAYYNTKKTRALLETWLTTQ